MKSIYIIPLLILTLNLVGAGSLEQPVAQNEEVELLQTCPDCTYIELTSITYPNGTKTQINVNMTKQGEDYNFTWGNTSQLGIYKYNTCGDLYHINSNQRIVTCETITFEVTYNGEKVSLSNSIIVIVFLLVAGILLVLGYSFSREHWLLKSFFNFGAVGMGLLAINSARIIASESTNLGRMGTTGITFGIVIFLFFFIYIFVYAFIEIIKALKEKRGVRWNY